MLTGMSNSDSNDAQTTRSIFSDPIAYLAELGIEAEVVADTSMPVAA